MKHVNIIKKINIIIVLIFAISIMLSNYSQATIGEIFSDADEFLEKRRPSRSSNRYNSIRRNFRFYG